MESAQPDNRMLREWWISNSFGGWASSTVCGANTRKYHGILCASDGSFEKRRILVSKFEDFAIIGGVNAPLSTNFYPNAVHPKGFENLHEFSFDGAVARWTYSLMSRRIAKEVWCARGANRSYVRYTLLSGPAVGIETLPLVSGRDSHSVGRFEGIEDGMRVDTRGVYFSKPFEWSLESDAGMFLEKKDVYYNMLYPQEREREEEYTENLFCPGKFSAYLSEGKGLTISCGVKAQKEFDSESLSRRMEMLVHNFKIRERAYGSDKLFELVRASDSFIVKEGDGYSVIAGYPYFGEWGRDTMISIPGLLGYTGRGELTYKVLERWMSYLKDGLMPNRIENSKAIYESADVSLWFSWCVGELERAGVVSQSDLRKYFYALYEIESEYRDGNEFVFVDSDGLLSLKKERSTWMDAQIDGRAVTPRMGKRIEINALWCDLLFRLQVWSKKLGLTKTHKKYMQNYLGVKNSMRKFYSKSHGYLLDGIEPADYSLRPNQLWALAISNCGIAGWRAKNSLDAVRNKLWVEGAGLRTLSIDDEKYMGKYSGSMRKRDAAYHQGTIWPWLCGAYAQAICNHGNSGLRDTLEEFENLVRPQRGALLSVCEVYNPADLSPAGCPSQAWSVAETIRGYVYLLEALEQHRDLKLLEARDERVLG